MCFLPPIGLMRQPFSTGPTLLADFNFSAPLTSWTTGRTGFSSAFATDEWLMQEAATSYANSAGVHALSDFSVPAPIMGQTAPVIHDGSGYGNRKALEFNHSDNYVRSANAAALDSDGADVCVRIEIGAHRTPANGSVLISKRQSSGGVGWVVIFDAGGQLKILVDAGATQWTTPALAGNLADGGEHYFTFLIDVSAELIYFKSDKAAATPYALTGLTSLTNIGLLTLGNDGITGGAPVGTHVGAVVGAVGVNAQSMYDEVFWQHGADPTSLMTDVSRECPISVPISATQAGHFGGGATIGTTQLPIAYCDELTSAPALFGLQCNGVYTNVITYSEALSNWTQSGTSTTTDNQADAPDGFRSASLFTAGATNDQITSNTFVTTSTWWYGMGIWIKEGSTGCTGRIIFYNETGAAEEGAVAFTATSAWQFIDFSDRATAGGVTMSIKIEIDTSGDSVYVWGAMVARTGRIQVCPPYLRTSGGAAVSVSSSYRCSTGVVNNKKGEIETIFRMSGAAELDGWLYIAPPTSLTDAIVLNKANSTLLARKYNDAAGVEDQINAIPTMDTGGIEYVLRHIWDDSAAGDETGGYESVIVRNGVTVLGAASPMEGTLTDTLHGIGLGTRTTGAGENILIARLRSWDGAAQAIP